ncbi:MAG: hypothetical protein ABWZ25_04110 [Chitinophagaceae bacterium]
MVHPENLPHFNSIRMIITTTELDHLLKNFAGAVRYTLPHPAQTPMAVRYRKRFLAGAAASIDCNFYSLWIIYVSVLPA